ncbi:STAS domain-containing protein [Streptomyces sp. NPDC001674]|uniref:STAS domain-containing protein n=1 Tax=Streptomyces sp. NPDC001674 TaxID=3154394 RepID=UPI00331C37D2
MTSQVTVRAESAADGARVIVCSGEFDIDTSQLLLDACRQVPGEAPVVVDVGQVSFADSSFLNALVQLRKMRPLTLRGPLPHQFHRLMEVTGALPLFDVRSPADTTR